MKSVLFIDDEENILAGLRDAMRSRRREWRMAFAPSGPAALELMQEQPFGAVVCDLSMPGMDGAETLGHIRDSHPSTIRVVLSGYADPSKVLRAAGVAHRFLAKPTRTDELTRVLEHALDLQDRATRETIGAVAGAAAWLPGAPETLGCLRTVDEPEDDPAAIEELVARDVPLAAHVLQLANSPFFGPGHEVVRLEEAAHVLGAGVIGMLARAEHSVVPWPPALAMIEPLRRRAMLVSGIAGQLTAATPHRDVAVTAGLLHDIGLWVLATQDPVALREVLESPAPGDVLERERARFGDTHAAIGGRVLELWGIPRTICNAVSTHHDAGIVDPAVLAIRTASLLLDGVVADGRIAMHTAGARLAQEAFGLSASLADSLVRDQLAVLDDWKAPRAA